MLLFFLERDAILDTMFVLIELIFEFL